MPTNTPQYRCTWCMQDSPAPICPRCEHECLDKTAPHPHEWSRRTLVTVECKVCGEVISMEEYLKLEG